MILLVSVKIDVVLGFILKIMAIGIVSMVGKLITLFLLQMVVLMTYLIFSHYIGTTMLPRVMGL